MTPSASPASCVPAEAVGAAAPALVLAGQSVRQLAQAAAAEGIPALALDAFGDRDTRAAARWQAWRGFDAGNLLDALHEAARAGAAGWIAGSGFEAHPGLLAAAAERLPLLGTAPDGWRRVRDPRRFFPLLDDLGLPHPDTRWDGPPADSSDWLVKDGAGCGGVHVRPAAGVGAAPGPTAFWQRRVAGTPMSVAFVADGRRALLLGVNEQLAGAPHAPFAWAGAVGPLPVAGALHERLDAALQRLVPACGLRGLASLDFMLRPGGGVALLEVNPRPGGTLQLYAPQSPLALHLRGCRGEGGLPARPRPQPVMGLRVLYAPRALHLSADTLRRLARRAWVHDLPLTPTGIGAGEPVCSLGATAPRADAVHALLRRRHAELIELLEDTVDELAC
ncbi:ATP-grasp domain-containing protein [Azohydromonas aeria]|uniref:ATP-grasp domain-containing protein n=1 Tax=Azohydromonas aeria TaxID=2590212 RepID=UPI0012FB2102|nr:ATP-grasp domain-containing protein [Azohydromonas aeria]